MGWNVKVLFGIAFAVFALFLMFSDALEHIGLKSRQSMIFEHAIHTSEEADHEQTEHSPAAEESRGVMDHTEEEGMYGHIMSFGPGESPHYHDYDLSPLEKVADIAQDTTVSALQKQEESNVVKIHLTAQEVIAEVAPDTTYHYWTFDGKVPGPLLRVREGDNVELTLSNHLSSTHNHSIDLHAVTGPGGGAVLTQVAPGESKSLRFKALNPGVYVYHCATPNVPMHMASGMYGLIIVEPEKGFSEVDKEFYVMQGELYTQGKLGETGFQAFDAEKMLYEKPEYVFFNGRVKSLVDHPMQANVGEKVRLFVGNGGVSLISSFHVIGEIFDTVYPEAATNTIHNVQTIVVPAGGATIVEFTLDVPGNYVLVDHALARLDKGAWGILNVEGKKNPEIFAAT